MPNSTITDAANTLRSAAKRLLDPLIADPTTPIHVGPYFAFRKAVDSLLEALEARRHHDDSSSNSPSSPQSSPDQSL